MFEYTLRYTFIKLDMHVMTLFDTQVKQKEYFVRGSIRLLSTYTYYQVQYVLTGITLLAYYHFNIILLAYWVTY